MRVERAARREREGTARLQVQEAERSGRLVIEARGVHFAHGEAGASGTVGDADPAPSVRGADAPRVIVRDFSTTIMRGDRVGLVGPNGAGKTTLLSLLLGTLAPQAGTVRLGTNLEVAYFDQLREQLDPQCTVFDAIADGAEFVEVGGQRRHVHGWLQDFLFSPERARTPVRALSGGERNRLLLARLFTRRFNLLVLDEPTNDLDMETLDLLEDRLLEFGGTLLLVSHDRAFLDAVVTSTLVFEGEGVVREYAGGYTDWVRQRPQAVATRSPGSASMAGRRPAGAPSADGPSSVKAREPVAPASRAKPERKRRLSFTETAELAELPARIEALELEREQLYVQLADPATLRDGSAVQAAQARLAEVDGTLETAMARWEELETIASGA
jgi:ATP-binding cassette subfamily F protein uup